MIKNCFALVKCKAIYTIDEQLMNLAVLYLNTRVYDVKSDSSTVQKISDEVKFHFN